MQKELTLLQTGRSLELKRQSGEWRVGSGVKHPTEEDLLPLSGAYAFPLRGRGTA